MQGERGIAEGKTVYVGGFGDEMTSEALHQIFSTFGEIIDVSLPRDPNRRSETGKTHRNFGFVEFSDGNDALDAVDNMHENEINGRELKVNLARNKPNAINTGSRKAIWASDQWLKTYEQSKDADANSIAPSGDQNGQQET